MVAVGIPRKAYSVHRTLPFTIVEGYGFSGPLSYQDAVAEFGWWSGVYIVARGGDGIAMDVGSATDIGDRLANHDRRGCWNVSSFGQGLSFYGHLEKDEQTRLFVEWCLRQQLNPLCGVR